MILWTLSNSAPVTLYGHALTIPGYLVWVAIIYAVAGTYVAHRIGRPLVKLDIEQQRREANFRAGLLRIRDSAEQIALLKGESTEHRRLMARFAAVKANWTAIMSRQKHLTFFTAGYGQVQMVIPILVAGPAYFAGAIGLGGLMQTASAFGRVEGALSFFVKAYPQLAEWKAIVERLDDFARRIACTASHRSMVEIVERGADSSIKVTGLALDRPDGTPLLNIDRLELAVGDATLVTGRSGVGKSTLLRLLAGIWPHVRGRVEMPVGARLLVLPQRPYLPEGTLRDAIAYPGIASPIEDERIAALLSEVGLSRLAEQLDEHAHWQQVLSLGEQQRVTVVRAILFDPDWLPSTRPQPRSMNPPRTWCMACCGSTCRAPPLSPLATGPHSGRCTGERSTLHSGPRSCRILREAGNSTVAGWRSQPYVSWQGEGSKSLGCLPRGEATPGARRLPTPTLHFRLGSLDGRTWPAVPEPVVDRLLARVSVG